PRDEFVDDAGLEGLDRFPVGLTGGSNPPLPGAVDLIQDRRRLQHGFRRDAATEQTRPTESLVSLHERHSLAEFGGAEGAGVSARPGADDDEIEVVRHRTAYYRRPSNTGPSQLCLLLRRANEVADARAPKRG